MVRFAIALCIQILAISVVMKIPVTAAVSPRQAQNDATSLHCISSGYFVPNAGQWPDSILFRGVSDDMTLWFSRTGICYQIDERRTKEAGALDPTQAFLKESVRTELVQSRFVNADTAVRVLGNVQLPFVMNFLHGNNSANWVRGVRAYSSIRYENVTDSIDVEFYFSNDKIEYDVVAQSLEALKQFEMDFPGSTLRRRSDGGFEIPSRYGVVSHEAPVTFLVHQGKRSPIASRVLLLEGSSRVQFEIDRTIKLDPKQLVVVDPYLSYSSYLGGSGAEDGVGGIEINPLNNHRIVCGTTKSSNFPLGTGGYDVSYGGNQDIFVANFNPDGSLASATFVGGGGDDVATGLAIGADEGSIFVCGYSNSSDFPVPPGAFDSSTQNGDGVLFRLNDVATSLVWSTYLGGSNTDQAAAIAIRQSSNPKEIVVCGHTSSSNFPTTAGCYDAAIGAVGVLDAFVAKFRADNGNIMFSTYYGGAQEEFCNAVAIGESGGATYIGGKTTSSGSGFPKKKQFDSSFVGASEGFVARIKPLGDSLVWSSWFGGNLDEEIVGLDFDNAASRLIVAGTTTSSNLPSTGGGLDGSQDAFYTRINPTTPAIEFSLYVGGSGAEAATDIAVRSNSDVYMTGTVGGTFPNVATCDGGFKGGSSDAFAVVLNSGGGQLFGTNFGGGGSDWGYAVAIDPSGDPLIAGVTASGDIPLSFQSWVDRTWEGGSDCFVARLRTAGNCPDSDGDCICDDVDNCPNNYNPNQANGDHDSRGDLCDNCPGLGVPSLGDSAYIDSDGDGMGDLCDNCPLVNSSDTSNPDNDEFGSPCDPCPNVFMSGSTAAASNTIRVSIFRVEPSTWPLLAIDYESSNSGAAQDISVCSQINVNLLIKWQHFGDSVPFQPLPTQGDANGYMKFAVGWDGQGPILPATVVVKTNVIVTNNTQVEWQEYSDQFGHHAKFSPALTHGQSYQYSYQQSLSTAEFAIVDPNNGDPVEVGFEIVHLGTASALCCQNSRGNVDCDTGNGVDISDLSAMIDALYLTFSPLCCEEEANVDGIGPVDIGDLTTLIDYLYISFTPLPSCP